MNLSANVTLREVERPTSVDEYGQPKYETVHEAVPARLTLRSRVARTAQGDFRQVDGDLLVEARWPLRAGDLATVESTAGEQYAILSVAEQQDVAGAVVFRSFAVARRRTS